MSVKVVYDGPFNAVDVPAAGCVAEKGKPIEVSKELADSLLEQDCWKAAQAQRAPAPVGKPSVKAAGDKEGGN